ncbi:MAG: hypothetical protein Q8P67_06985 [archaeon]|nr:hypothetical protein [archaeon]
MDWKCLWSIGSSPSLLTPLSSLPTSDWLKCVLSFSLNSQSANPLSIAL